MKKLSFMQRGSLTNFEFEVLEQCCEFCEVEIHLSASRFNTKMVKKICDIRHRTGGGI